MLTVVLLVIANTFMTCAWYGLVQHCSAPIAAFAYLYLGESMRWNYVASFGCILAAVIFAFWGQA